ncbi:MAG: ATP-binding protein [Bacteroidales bacterium]|jgi:MinD superfamily P-loop ATPase|nr:ATP-binding protein [Bacteroidales bacterium]MCI1784831.1 ATP-binding protein [Bacteroidales bacterium]
MEIAVISGKGGTGKSSISAAFASLLGKAIVVDCDVDASNMYLIFAPEKASESVFISGAHAYVDAGKCTGCGLCAAYCRFDAIKTDSGAAVINDQDCEGCALCSRICPSEAITMIPDDKSRIYTGTFRYGRMVYGYLAPGEENSGKLVNGLRRKSSEIAGKKNIPATVLDGPPGTGCPVMSTVTGSDRIVFVTEPSLSGFSDLKRVSQSVKTYGIPGYLIINKYTLNESVSKDIEAWCSKEGIKIAAKIPFDEDMVKAMISGLTIAEYKPHSETTRLLKKALSEITGINRKTD